MKTKNSNIEKEPCKYKNNFVIAKTNTTIVKSNEKEYKKESSFICEHTLVLVINDMEIKTISCTQTNLVELAVGQLFLDGWIREKKDILEIKKEASLEQNESEGNIQPASTTYKILVKNKEKKEPSLSKLKAILWKKDWIFNLAKIFSKGMPIHEETQGVHSCFLAQENTILFSCEDIGRHNAIDKSIGFAILNEIDLSQTILYTSGRTPLDVVKKAIISGIPVLVSKALPTYNAINLAKQYGLVLISKAYPDQFALY